MDRREIVIHVQGGMVQGVYGEVPGIQAVVVDWDVADAQPDEPGIVRVLLPRGSSVAAVCPYAVRPLCELAGSDTEAAIKAAVEAGWLPEPCECERPGYFCCGVPGVVAHLEGGHLAEGAVVERCDQCQRYPDDDAARQRLDELGLT